MVLLLGLSSLTNGLAKIVWCQNIGILFSDSKAGHASMARHLRAQPAVRDGVHIVLRRQRVAQRNRKHERVLLGGILPLEQKVLVVEDGLAVHVGDGDPERLGVAVNGRVELRGRGRG